MPKIFKPNTKNLLVNLAKELIRKERKHGKRREGKETIKELLS